MIKIKNAYKSFGKEMIFEDISLSITKPGLYVLWGASGTGKSTLLNLIAGFDSFDSGECNVDCKVMTIFQNYELISELNIYNNIFLGKKPSDEDKQLLKALHIDTFIKQYPNELSGGQKQRVGIARALISKPRIICCDEPTEALDVENKEIILDLFKEYSKNHIVIMATHQKDVVEKYADHLIQIKNHKLKFYKGSYHEEEIPKDQEVKPNLDKVSKIINKIISKKNRIFVLAFMVLLVIFQSISILKNVLFYVPETTNVLSADMMYFETDDLEVLNEVITNTQPVISFAKPTTINGTDYVMNILPYMDIEKNLSINGDSPHDTYVLINQNVSKEVFKNDYKDKTISLTISILPYQYDVDVSIAGVIQEPDTSAMNIYYDLDGIKSYMSTIALNDGGSLSSYFENHATLYQKNVGYNNIENNYELIKGKLSVTAFTTLYDERKTQISKSVIYQYVFTGMIWVVILLLTIFVVVITRKETEYYQKSFAILMSQNIDSHWIKKKYITKKIRPIIVLVGIDLIVLLVMQLLFPQINTYLLMAVTVFEVALFIFVLFISNSNLEQQNISKIMKREF